MPSEVRVIAWTIPESEQLSQTLTPSEDLVAYCARVSNPANQNNTTTSGRLLNYLIKNKHWSPFEMVSVNMEIITTRDIARQILRHRSFSFQEFSQRYADPTAVAEFEPREARLQDSKNRQNSIESDDKELQLQWEAQQRLAWGVCQGAYKWALEHGIAKEQARAVLQEGLTESKMYMHGTLRSWIHYCQLRMKPGTQKEHRVIAEKCFAEICRIFPSIVEALKQDA